MNNKEKMQLKHQCDYFLHGHGSIKPIDYFKMMSDYSDPQEQMDRYGQGEYLQAFERDLSKMFGHEDCVFMQSGTMAQLIAMRIWSEQAKNNTIAFHPTCHLELHEQLSYRHLHNLHAFYLGEKNHVISLNDLQTMPDKPSTVLMELPLREIGGQLPNWADLVQQVHYLRSENIKVHVDGARIWECKSFYQKSYAEIVSLFDSAYVSFYKGIGAIAGAVLLGNKEFIQRARIWNRRHGGNLVTSFPLYMSAKYNLEQRLHRFDAYDQKTQEIHQMLRGLSQVQFTPSIPQVNMFHLVIDQKPELCLERALIYAEKEKVWGWDLFKPEQGQRSRIEWYVGDAAMKLSLEQIKGYFQFILN